MRGYLAGRRKIYAVLLLAGIFFFAFSGEIYGAEKQKLRWVNVKSQIDMIEGGSKKLKVKAVPGEKGIKYQWSSSAPKVVSVNKSGKVKAKKPGTAKITCRIAGETDSKVSCKIHVLAKAKKVAWAKQPSSYMTVKSTQTLRAVVTPKKAKNLPLTWTSSNSKVASVSKNGKVTAKKAGKATITCKVTSQPKKKISVKLEVVAKAENIRWTEAPKIYMTPDSFQLLQTAVTPKKAGNLALLWESSDRRVAVVNKAGKVTAKKTGEVTITCKVASQPQKKVSSWIQVVIPSEELAIDTSQVVLQVGESIRREAEILPEKATLRTAVYTSSNPEIASVDSTGTVTARSEGKVTITARPKDGFAAKKSYTLRVIGRLQEAVKFVAHRGLSSEAPENTVRAFRLAGEAGFWGVETDVRKTKDGHFVLMHDASLEKMCGVNRMIGELTFAELRRTPITAGSQYEKYRTDASATTIPTLEEYLMVCREFGVVPMIEIKFGGVWEYDAGESWESEYRALNDTTTGMQDLRRLYETTMEIMGKDTEVAFMTFDLETLVRMRLIANEAGNQNVYLRHILHVPDMKAVNQYLQYHIDPSIDCTYLDQDAVNAYQADGIEIGVWTVNDRLKAWNLSQQGVSYITTNKKLW